MKKSVLSFAALCLATLLQAAPPGVGMVIKKSYPAYGKDMPVLVCWSEADVPHAAETLGTFQVAGQPGANCADSATVMRLLQREARKVGGNTLLITAHRVNGGCHQMMASVLRTDEDVLFNKYPDIYTAVLSPFKSGRQNRVMEKGASSTRYVSRVIKKAYPPYADNMPVLVCHSEADVPPDIETLGTLQTNTEMDAAHCDSASVAGLLEQETRRAGGNVLLVTGCRVSRGCYQMMGTIMRTSENRMRALFPEAYAQTFSSPERQERQSLFSKVRFEVGAGYAYRTASTMPGLPAVTDNLVSKLKNGASIQAALDIFPSRYMGVGLMYYTYLPFQVGPVDSHRQLWQRGRPGNTRCGGLHRPDLRDPHPDRRTLHVRHPPGRRLHPLSRQDNPAQPRSSDQGWQHRLPCDAWHRIQAGQGTRPLPQRKHHARMDKQSPHGGRRRGRNHRLARPKHHRKPQPNKHRGGLALPHRATVETHIRANRSRAIKAYAKTACPASPLVLAACWHYRSECRAALLYKNE